MPQVHGIYAPAPLSPARNSTANPPPPPQRRVGRTSLRAKDAQCTSGVDFFHGANRVSRRGGGVVGGATLKIVRSRGRLARLRRRRTIKYFIINRPVSPLDARARDLIERRFVTSRER